MNKAIITIHNAETGDIIQREMNATELAQHAKDKADAETRAAAQAETKAAKSAAEAKLAALGLTTDDLKALGL